MRKSIIFDENFSPYLSKGLNVFQSGRESEQVEVLHLNDICERGTTDDKWIPIVAKLNSIVVTQDNNIYRTQTINQLCKDNNLGMFFFKQPKNTPIDYWNWIKWILKHWDQLKGISHSEIKPFSYVITYKSKEPKLLNN